MDNRSITDPDQLEQRDEVYRAHLNMETGLIAWKELQRFFAGGHALQVAAELDLVEVAFQISEDNTDTVKQWLESRQLQPVPDEQALQWFEQDADVWAVVVSPYVLVQSEQTRH